MFNNFFNSSKIIEDPTEEKIVFEAVEEEPEPVISLNQTNLKEETDLSKDDEVIQEDVSFRSDESSDNDDENDEENDDEENDDEESSNESINRMDILINRNKELMKALTEANKYIAKLISEKYIYQSSSFMIGFFMGIVLTAINKKNEITHIYIY